MRTGLIGYTGYVGSTLLRSTSFDGLYNSSNIQDLRGQHVSRLVCAGVSAAKWIANANPEADAAGIRVLTDVLEGVTADEFVLISTVDVYPNPTQGGDETTVIDGIDNHAYGRNRRALERWIADRFARTRIIRLPALFGTGLRKNALYDLIHGNQVEKINPATAFQWYPMSRLWSDIERVSTLELPLVNLFTEPVATQDIVDAFFFGARTAAPSQPAPRYDVGTRYAEPMGGRGHYLLSATECLGEIARFVAAERRAAS